MSAPFEWNDARTYKRGKVLTAEQLNDIGRFGRYLDTDGDGITYRTYPGTHPTKGAFFTRGTSRDEYAVYTEDGAAYKRNMDRLIVKWHTAKTMVPQPALYQELNQSPMGVLFFGTSTYSAEEAMDQLREQGVFLDALRVKGFPFSKTVEEFVGAHRTIFVIEQNRDAQMRGLLMLELQIDPAKLVPILNYDGMPITAHAIASQISRHLQLTTPQQNELSATVI
jgi:2-oxoglutarate ferredoxin oxidoreductase subunit alpha